MSAGIRAKIMKKFTKIATAIVAGCAIVGVTTGGAILLNDDDKDIIINVDTTPQEEPQEPEIPTEGEDIPQDTPVEETPTEGETEDEIPTEDEVPTEEEPEESEEKTSPEDIPSEEETPEIGYITVRVEIYNRNSDSRKLQSIEIIEYNNILGTSESVSNLVYWTKLNYPKRREESSPNVISEESKNLNDYLTYSSDHEIDLIVYLE